MPQKLNGAGEMQNYIPAGNGEESGQYTDDSSTGVKNNLKNTLSQKLPDEEFKNLASKTLDNTEEEYCGYINDFLNSDPGLKLTRVKGKESAYYNGKNSIEIGDFNTLWDEASLLSHELAHGIDHRGFRGYNYVSSTYISPTYGCTLADLVKEEIIMNVDTVDLDNEIRSIIYTDEYNKLKDEKNKLRKMYDQDVIKLYREDPEYKKLADEYVYLEEVFKESDTYDPDYRRKRNKKVWAYNKAIKYHKNHLDSAVNYYNKLEECDALYNKNRQRAALEYMDISDMVDASIGKSADTFWGHKSSYWKDKESRGTEAFAEIFSALASNPLSRKQLEKYIPMSLKLFKEIMSLDVRRK